MPASLRPEVLLKKRLSPLRCAPLAHSHSGAGHRKERLAGERFRHIVTDNHLTQSRGQYKAQYPRATLFVLAHGSHRRIHRQVGPANRQAECAQAFALAATKRFIHHAELAGKVSGGAHAYADRLTMKKPRVAGHRLNGVPKGVPVVEMGADALLALMLANPEELQGRERREITLEHEALDWLLLRFLEEILYYKDAQRLFLRVVDCEVDSDRPTHHVRATLEGEPIDPQRHLLSADVKAVTLHRLAVFQRNGQWIATVVVDL